MRVFATALMFALTLGAGAASAQGPAPQTILSSTLTRAQEAELNNRLGRLQQRFDALARETDLRASAVRNVAIEIFGADPNLDFETYVSLIENGARELRTYITGAHERTETDPVLAALRERAIAVAGEGRLTDARALYDQLIAQATESLEVRWARENSERDAERRTQTLAVAADMAEAARLTFVAADYRDAARRYAEAAALVPESELLVRWRYVTGQADALTERGRVFLDAEALAAATQLYRVIALSLVPREQNLRHWASTQGALANVLRILGGHGDGAALEQADIAYHEAALAYIAADDNDGFFTALRGRGDVALLRGERGDLNKLDVAVDLYRMILVLMNKDAAPLYWAYVQNNLGVAYNAQGRAGVEGAFQLAIEAFEAAATAANYSNGRELWLNLNLNLGSAQAALGHGGEPSRYDDAIATYRAVLDVITPEAYPAAWAQFQLNLANAYYAQAIGGSPAGWEAALATAEEAERVLRGAADQRGYAMVRNTMGVILAARGSSNDSEADLRAAIGHYEAVLVIVEPQTDHLLTSGARTNLCDAYNAIAQSARPRVARSALRSGRPHCDAALSTVASQHSGRARFNLARNAELSGDFGGGTRAYRASRDGYRAALQYIHPTVDLVLYTAVQEGLARVEAGLARLR